MTENTRLQTQKDYTVLARKYRPGSFDGLIGQEPIVRTLTNAVEAGRLAQAFILTGVRGVGKTTTARIIARVLNCIGEDGNGGPTATPCGICEHCIAIVQDRHVDVQEMDAASRTGVDDIRELIESVRYRPSMARYKVYIIDEVHMLSKNAFNALLKTLEEPPEHVKFIFATTEIRKIPVTVLSRCQRFDLRRVNEKTLFDHFRSVADSEGVEVSETALDLIARAADGSVRDGLSLLDQAISHSTGLVDDRQISEMLGLADRSQTFLLFETILMGKIGPALKIFEQLYTSGADPSRVIEDLLEITHLLTRIKVTPSLAEDPGIPEIERVKGKTITSKLTMASIARAWQMLLKGLSEVRVAPSPKQAVEMVLVRLAYSSDLPTPAEALKAMQPNSIGPSSQTSMKQSASLSSSQGQEHSHTAIKGVDTHQAPQSNFIAESSYTSSVVVALPKSFSDVAELAGAKGEALLRSEIINNMHLVSFEKGRIEVALGQHAKKESPYKMAKFLSEATPIRWKVSISSQRGDPPLQQQWDRDKELERNSAEGHPLVESVLRTFPGATVESVRTTDDR
ncbi:MAG: DNA polymerase III subunit gamma/tau [Magnetovibrio sp.]|nr:DNA polymerase III subunit gamma/tau [Magnetovibrio sp.]|tara:strand:+ start:1320 stop:3026 length:1707 start_codon:yes stop_codon:yes gene_type:complete